MRNKLRKSFITTCVFVILIAVAGTGVCATLGKVDTTTTTKSSTSTTELRSASDSPRKNLTTFDLTTFADSTGRSPVSKVKLQLFSDLAIVADLIRFESRAKGDFTWFGRANGLEGHDVVLTVVGGELAGMLFVEDKLIRIRPYPNKDNLSLVYEVGPEWFAREHGDNDDKLEYVEQTGDGYLVNQTDILVEYISGSIYTKQYDDGAMIDILVGIDTETHSKTPSFFLHLQSAVDVTNMAFSASGITPRIQIVNEVLIDYSRPSSGTNALKAALAQLNDPHDGNLDGLLDVRNTVAADVVAYIMAKPSGTTGCGFANMFASIGNYYDPENKNVGSDQAFFVVDIDCMINGYTFAHELGHTLGARHDWFKDNRVTPYDFSHGFASPNARLRTIMAYNDVCKSKGTSCFQVPRFSNPNVWHIAPWPWAHLIALGSTGSKPANNSRSINQMAWFVANHRWSGSR